jgi:hypothetical protein
MIYRGPGYLAVIWFGSSLSLLSRQQVTSLSQSSYVSPFELTDGREGGAGRGAESYFREKAWSSINHSIFSALYLLKQNLLQVRNKSYI